jgi:DNA topoisomerase-1
MGTSEQSWWRRVGSPERGFRYLKLDGDPLTSKSARARIESLVIPPAWEDVHISPDAAREIQAWGRDQAGRQQYIYSERAVKERDRRKWRRVYRFGMALPQLRARVNEDLRRPDLDRDKVLALIVRFMNQAFFRVGSERYAVCNRTHGIATLHKKHVEICEGTLVFTYAGKQRKDLRRVVVDDSVGDLMEELAGLPGRRLFQFVNGDGRPQKVTADAVNRYVKDATGKRYTSKDLRTFGGTVRAATILADLGPAADEREAKKNLALCCRLVSAELGNTEAIAREAYIHPAVFEEYLARGRTIENTTRGVLRPVQVDPPADYYPEEEALLRFLKKYG